MPFDGEFASYKPLSRILNNPKVQDVIRRCRRRGDALATPPVPIIRSPIVASDVLPSLVLAIDGSYHQVPVDNGFPAAELACLTAAAVLIDVEKQRELDRARPVDPRDARTTHGATAVDCALPGCNVILDEPTPKASFRRGFFEGSKEVSLFEGGESLIETFEALLLLRTTTGDQECPLADECGAMRPDDSPARVRVDRGETRCTCSKGVPLFSTDALRMHEGFNSSGPSGAMFAEAMQVWERLWMVNFLRGLESQGLLGAHKALAIVMDGPLAVFGHPAWLSQAITRELCRLNVIARAAGADLLIIGIEKSGMFVDHFAALDAPRQPSGQSDIPARTALLLTDAYIRQNILISAGKTYGKDTYFGRKLFYKTRTGSRIVASLPFFADAHRDLTTAREDQYPRLADAMGLLDAMFSVRYPNALMPLVVAHAEAAIPLGAARRALDHLIAHLRG